MFAINKKRLLLSVWSVALSTALVSAADLDTQNDTSLHALVSSIHNDRVVCSGDKVVVYALPKIGLAVTTGIASGVLLAEGAFLYWFDSSHGRVLTSNTRQFYVVMALFAISGALVAYNCVNELTKQTPLFTFDAEGMKFLDNRVVLSWQELHRTQTKQHWVSYKNEIVCDISFYNKQNDEILHFKDESDFFFNTSQLLPISVKQLADLVAYYQKRYGKQQA